MNEQESSYHISFFKPTTPAALKNRNMVLLFVSIWAVAIFGFQITLKVLGKPTKESTLIAFESVWKNVKSGTASTQELQVFAQTSLSVLGKNFISPEHREVLDNAVSWSLLQLADGSEKEGLLSEIKSFEKLKAETEDITDSKYIAARNKLAANAAPILGLNSNDVRKTILSLELTSEGASSLKTETVQNLPSCMSLYLTHNQSFLTDARFLGFPFHYFYTAIFLLVLFVGLCWMYCYRTDRINAVNDIQD